MTLLSTQQHLQNRKPNPFSKGI